MRKWTIILASVSFLMGCAVYMLFRSPSVKVFSWLDAIGLKDFFLNVRPDVSKDELPDWLLYSFPDGCWVFSYVLFMDAIWMARIREGVFFLLLLPVIALASELLQGTGLLRGTFDWGDVIAYSLGAILGFLWVQLMNIKTSTTI